MNICPRFSYIAALLVATMFPSCTKVEIEEPVLMQGTEICFGTTNGFKALEPVTKSLSESETRLLLNRDPNVPGSLGLGVSVIDGIELPIQNQQTTKGSQISSISVFDVAAYYHVKENTNAELYFSDSVINGKNTSEQYYWPTIGYMNFIATYPSGLIADRIENHVDDYGHIESFSYTIPDEILNQQDIMVATVNNVDNYEKCKTNTPVSLGFKHLLAAVKFKVGEMQMIKIKSLSIEGVIGGTITLTPNSDGTWSYEGGEQTNYVIISTPEGDNAEPNIDTSAIPSGRDITGNDNGMMMFVMPQLIGESHKIKITYSDLITGKEYPEKEISFGGDLSHMWEAGKTTVYSLNITNEVVGIQIPSPPDADAHYVRIDMPYDLTQFRKYEDNGIRISNIVVTADWLDDKSNTASQDKRDIYINTKLSEMQARDFYTDEVWELAYTINRDGEYEYTKGSPDNPVKNENINILGEKSLSLDSGSHGNLYLFLDENNGTTDRNGLLKITADITQGQTKRTGVTLSQGYFKQLCPCWNREVNLGVESFEDTNLYSYGFSYNRVVTYINPDIDSDVNKWDDLSGWDKFWSFLKLIFTGSLMGEVLPDMSQAAPGFVTVVKLEDVNIVKSVTLNYSYLNSVKSIANDENDGLINTRALYNYTGSVDIANLEEELDNVIGSWKQPVAEGVDNPDDYAAFAALKCNRMRELRTYVTDANGKLTTNYKAILHKDSNGADIIEWYLPSKEEAKSLWKSSSEFESYPVSPLNGIYWSSTAGEDPKDGSNGFAYSYTCNQNQLVGESQLTDRTELLKVRAVRKKPTAN